MLWHIATTVHGNAMGFHGVVMADYRNATMAQGKAMVTHGGSWKLHGVPWRFTVMPWRAMQFYWECHDKSDAMTDPWHALEKFMEYDEGSNAPP